MFRIVLPDEPMAWRRAIPLHGGPRTDPEMREYQRRNAARIAWPWRQRVPLFKARVEAEFFMKRPLRCPDDVSRAEWASGEAVLRPVKPDIDNFYKMTLDILVKAGVLVDDCVVVSGGHNKWMHAVGDTPHTEIVVRVPVRAT